MDHSPGFGGTVGGGGGGATVDAHVEDTFPSYFNKGRPANRGLRIRHTVHDANGDPVAGATVVSELTLPDGTVLSASGDTNSEGNITFRLGGTPPDGSYTSQVTSISGTDINFVQCTDADGTMDESKITYTVSGTSVTETGVIDECAL